MQKTFYRASGGDLCTTAKKLCCTLTVFYKDQTSSNLNAPDNYVSAVLLIDCPYRLLMCTIILAHFKVHAHKISRCMEMKSVNRQRQSYSHGASRATWFQVHGLDVPPISLPFPLLPLPRIPYMKNHIAYYNYNPTTIYTITG